MDKNKNSNPNTVPVSLALLHKTVANVYQDLGKCETNILDNLKSIDDSLKVLTVTFIRKGIITEEDLIETINYINSQANDQSNNPDLESEDPSVTE